MDDEMMDDLADTFGRAWEQERERIGRGIAPKGSKTKAGLSAVFDRLTQAGYSIVPTEPTA